MCADVQSLGARLVCPGGDIKIMQLGLKELVKTFGTEPPVASKNVY
jgi:hypothetical protein